MQIHHSSHLAFRSDKSLVLICGMPGSGKSTFAHKYLERFHVIDNDDSVDSVCNQLTNHQIAVKKTLNPFAMFKTMKELLEQATEHFFNEVHHSLSCNPITFVVGNFTEKKLREDFLKQFEGEYKHKYAIVLDISEQTLKKQVRNPLEFKVFLSNLKSFQKQLTNSEDWQMFDVVYVLTEQTIKNVSIELRN